MTGRSDAGECPGASVPSARRDSKIQNTNKVANDMESVMGNAMYTTVDGAQVGILMGSASDWPTMEKCSGVLSELAIAHECNVISAHRHPERAAHYATSARERGLKVLICAAGGAAHL
ncbi:MAG: AIR carboxylase family protein, partial [Phycisphaerales bacterium]|nr:AIR carboxylase family protein [Phycisphaerales bacterium]